MATRKTTTTTTKKPPAPAPKVDKIDERSLSEQYGMAWAVINGDPEIKALFKKAYGDGKTRWSPEKFKSQFQSTAWYRKHSESWRQSRILELSDPKAWVEKKNNLAAQVERVLGSQGIVLPAGTTPTAVADALLRSGATDQSSMLEYLSNLKDVTVAQDQGEAGSAIDQLQKMAYSYGYEPSDPKFYQKAADQIAFGQGDITQYENMIREAAASSYPVFAEQLRSGAVTVRDIASPYIESMARTLELSPDDINLKDENIQKAISAQYDEKGQPITKSVWQFTKDLKNDPRWQHTKNAKDSMESTAVGVLKAFGFTA
jgi:hypothetical protein